MKVPGSELARVSLADSLRGANWPGSEKAVNHELLVDSEESACPEQRFRPNEGGSGRGSSSSVNVTAEKCVVCDLTGLDRGKIAFYRLIQKHPSCALSD